MVAHEVILRGLRTVSSSPSATEPVICERTEQEVIPAILADLSHKTASRGLTKTIVPKSYNEELRLFQPVHGVFNVALFEVACRTFGEPRLDPDDVESAGLVVRRHNGRTAQGWMHGPRSIQGWVSFRNELQKDLDPDPTQRRPLLRSGNPEIDRQLAAMQAPWDFTEVTSGLFVAPPEVCAAAGRTILYGLIPVASAELAEGPSGSEGGGYAVFDEKSTRRFQNHLPYLLKTATPISFGSFGRRRVDATYADKSDLRNFVSMVRQLAIELNAFDDDSPRGSTLYRQLDALTLPYGKEQRSAGSVLRLAARVFVNKEPGIAVELPDAWPGIGSDRRDAIAHAVLGAMNERLTDLRPRTGRFDDRNARYTVRGFVRVKRDDDCPPDLVWSSESVPFSIAPWYENGKRPPVQVMLPDVTRASVKNFKPNVAFNVPGNLFGMLDANSPKDVLDGAARTGTENAGLGLGWICGFNIPIITICAFIVLYIFLTLLNIVFWWLPFIKICIPIPIPQPTQDQPPPP